MDKEKIQLQRRFDEIKDAYDVDFRNAKDLKTFYGRIFDFIKYVEGQKHLKKLIEKHLKDEDIEKLDKKLIKLGDEILEDLRERYKFILNILKEKDIKLPTASEVYSSKPKGQVFSLSAEESLGSGLDSLGNRLKEDVDIDIREVPRILSSFYMVVGDLKMLGIADLFPQENDIVDKNRKYDYLLQQKDRRLDFLRISDYRDILSVKDAIDDEGVWDKGLSFKFTPSYKYVGSSYSDWSPINEKNEINKNKEDYFKAVQRTYNLLLDLLDGKTRKLKKFLLFINEYWEMQLVRDFILKGIPFFAGTFALGKYWSQIANFIKDLLF